MAFVINEILFIFSNVQTQQKNIALLTKFDPRIHYKEINLVKPTCYTNLRLDVLFSFYEFQNLKKVFFDTNQKF